VKNQFKLTVISGIFFSYLFYEQNFGINAMVFAFVLLGSMAITYRDFRKNKYSIICGIGSLFSAFFIYWNNSTVSIIAYFISLLGMMSFKNEGNFTIVNYALTYILNFITSPFIFFVKSSKSYFNIQDKESKDDNSPYDKTIKVFGYIAVLVIILIFFFIYRSANPLFDQYTQNISLFNIDYGFVFFCVLGCLLMSIYLYDTAIKIFFKIEERQQTSINPQNFLGSYLAKYRLQTIFFLFIVLNLMLLFINALDINYLYLSHTMPKGITQAQFVHNGVGTLIFSIVLGASIICYLFKGELNFIQENKTIKVLVYIWIAQNIFMVISTMLRNNIYVFNCGLTGKRIGVYYYLFFTIIGLLFTAYKIHKQKTVYFLYSTNTWIWYIILVLSCSLNWENIIFNNQMKRYNSSHVLDFEYATRFKETNLPELINLFNVGKKDSVDFKDPNNVYSACNDYYNYKRNIESHMVSFLFKHDSMDWQSANKNDDIIYNGIIKLNKQHQFDSITIYSYVNYQESKTPVKAIACLTNLKTLFIIGEGIDYNNLPLLKNVEKIRWSNVNFQKLKYFKSMPKLKELELCNISEPSANYFKSVLPNIKVTTISTTSR